MALRKDLIRLCTQCGYKWTKRPRKKEPELCPRCRSREWFKPQTEKSRRKWGVNSNIVEANSKILTIENLEIMRQGKERERRRKISQAYWDRKREKVLNDIGLEKLEKIRLGESLVYTGVSLDPWFYNRSGQKNSYWYSTWIGFSPLSKHGCVLHITMTYGFNRLGKPLPKKKLRKGEFSVRNERIIDVVTLKVTEKDDKLTGPAEKQFLDYLTSIVVNVLKG